MIFEIQKINTVGDDHMTTGFLKHLFSTFLHDFIKPYSEFFSHTEALRRKQKLLNMGKAILF